MKKKLMIFMLVISLILLGNASIGEASGPTSDTKIAEQIDKMLSGIYKRDEPGAAVIAVKDGKVLFRKGYGMADLELGVPVKPEMVFAIGSATKSFTAMAVMILKERGKLSLDDEITRFLPDYPTQGQTITIRHLLSHTSGIKRLHSLKSYWREIREDVSVEELIGFFKDEPMEFAPGEKYRYCNSGYHLLGLIVERASGQGYERFVQENILDPLNMINTYFARNDRIIPNRTRGYHKKGDRFVNAPNMSYSHLYAAGDFITNVDDLARWSEALYTEKLISNASLEEAFTPFTLKSGEPAGYGLGWFVGELKGRKNVYHGGGIYGYIAHTILLSEEHVYVALLSNRIDPQANPPTEAVAERVAAIAIGDPFQKKERKAIELSPEELKKYAGAYSSGNIKGKELVFTVIFENRRLFLSAQGSKFEILPESRTIFFIQDKVSFFTFEFDNRGEVTQMVLHSGGEGGRKMIFKKK